MNIMDKKEIVSLSKAINLNLGVTRELIIKCIIDYCLEKGKKQEDVDKLIQLLTSPLGDIVINNCITYALEYYERKYNIVKVIKEDKVLAIF